MGVMAAGWCDIAQVCHKILVAFLTMVLRIGDMKFDRSSRNQISNIMQLALIHMLASGKLPAQRARTVGLIAVFFDHLCFGQIFNPLIFNIRLVLTRTVLFRWPFGRRWHFHPASLLQNAGLDILLSIGSLQCQFCSSENFSLSTPHRFVTKWLCPFASGRVIILASLFVRSVCQRSFEPRAQAFFGV